MKRKITKEMVVIALSWVTEHQNLQYEEIRTHLLNMGWIFGWDEFRAQFKPTLLRLSQEKKMLKMGANILTNIVFEGRESWSYIKERFLIADGEYSVYSVIRHLTKNMLYTKSFVDRFYLNNN